MSAAYTVRMLDMYLDTPVKRQRGRPRKNPPPTPHSQAETVAKVKSRAEVPCLTKKSTSEIRANTLDTDYTLGDDNIAAASSLAALSANQVGSSSSFASTLAAAEIASLRRQVADLRNELDKTHESYRKL